MRVKITEPGWEGFTDLIGSVPFVDGVSSRSLEPHELANLGSSIRLIEYDDGAEGDQVGISTGTVENRHRGIDPVEPLKTGAIPGINGKPPITRSALVIHPKILPEAELEAIADAKGIAGLREIATQWGIRGRDIQGMLTQILGAQKAAAAQDKKLEGAE